MSRDDDIKVAVLITMDVLRATLGREVKEAEEAVDTVAWTGADGYITAYAKVCHEDQAWVQHLQTMLHRGGQWLSDSDARHLNDLLDRTMPDADRLQHTRNVADMLALSRTKTAEMWQHAMAWRQAEVTRGAQDRAYEGVTGLQDGVNFVGNTGNITAPEMLVGGIAAAFRKSAENATIPSLGNKEEALKELDKALSKWAASPVKHVKQVKDE